MADIDTEKLKSSAEKEVAALRKELARLSKDVEGALSSAANSGASSYRRLRGKAADRFEDLASTGSEWIDTAGHELVSLERKASRKVHENPGTSVAVALGLGALFAYLILRDR